MLSSNFPFQLRNLLCMAVTLLRYDRKRLYRSHGIPDYKPNREILSTSAILGLRSDVHRIAFWGI